MHPYTFCTSREMQSFPRDAPAAVKDKQVGRFLHETLTHRAQVLEW